MTIKTVPDNDRRADYTATPGQDEFEVDFPFYSETDLRVYVDDVLKTLTTHYTVADEGEQNGGSITFITPMVGDEKVAIVGDMTVEKTFQWVTSGDFRAVDLNREINRVVMMLQQITEILSRRAAIGAESSDPNTTSYVLPTPINGKIIGWSVVDGVVTMVNLDGGSLSIPIQDTEPDPTVHKLWYDSANNVLKYWDGAAYQEPGSVDISGKQNRDTDAVENNIAIFDASGHTVDASIAAADLIQSSDIDKTLVATQRGRNLDSTSSSTSLTSYQRMSDRFTITPTAVTGYKLEGFLIINYRIESATTSTADGDLSAGYRNGAGADVVVGQAVTLRAYAKSTNGASIFSTCVIPVSLTSSNISDLNDWRVMVMGKSSEAADVIEVTQAHFVWEEFQE